MTFGELLRLYADEVDRREAAEQQIEELKKQLEQARSATLADSSQWLSVGEAAKYIGRPKSYLGKDRIQSPPQIPYRQDRAGGKVTYLRTDLDAYSESRIKGRKKNV